MFKIYEGKNQVIDHSKEDEHGFQSKEKELKEKITLVTMKMEKNKKYEHLRQCIKEAKNR